jgi:hypothetical protein
MNGIAVSIAAFQMARCWEHTQFWQKIKLHNNSKDNVEIPSNEIKG